MFKYYKLKFILLLLITTFQMGVVLAQTKTQVKGVLTDVKSGETLPFVNIIIPGTTMGTTTDVDGNYAISMPEGQTKLKFSYIGYHTVDKEVTPNVSQVLNIKLQVDASLLNEVVIKGKAKYRNRENPAVQLIRKVIENKDKNRASSNDFVEFEQYEKISFAISNLSSSFKNKRIFKNYQFLFTEQDSGAVGGKTMLPAYMEEKLSNVYYRKAPYAKKTVIQANRKAEFDSKFVDNNGLSNYFNRLYEDINIYDNNIAIATNQLLSPIAGTSPTFYKFFIRDTVKTNDPWLIEVGFVPRNKTDMLFEGKLFVTLDGKYAVESAYLTVNKDINLNFMRDLEATIQYKKGSDGRYNISKTSLGMEFAVGEKGAGMYGQRIVNYKDYKINNPRPDETYKGPSEEIAFNPLDRQTESKWSEMRHIPLDNAEKNIYRNVDTLQTIPAFRRTMDIATLLLAGYKSFGRVEVGPVNTFYSFNPIEGFRLRFGGRTTTEFSKRIYFEGYAAYGFKDEKWKYFAGGTYSLNNKSVYHFPLNYVRATFQRDTKIPGQDLQFVQEDNFLLSFKRGENNRWLYNDIYKFEYMREFANHFSYKLNFTKWSQTPAGILLYGYSNNSDEQKITKLNNSEVSLELRYAPNEQFYQGKLYRSPMFNKYPVFTFRYAEGLKVLEGETRYQNLRANIFKRMYLSQLGYMDVNLDGGYIIGKNISFPLLNIHRANQTYAYQLNSYNLMNFLEFVSDHYASVDVQYYMNGFLLNKIPLIKKLKLREVFSFKAVVGGLRDENNPSKGAHVYAFPIDEDGLPVTYTFNKEPYMEASVGIANIFKLLRVDLVKRFNYLDNPNVSEWGVRARFKLDF